MSARVCALWAALTSSLGCVGCRSEVRYPEIGLKIAGPVDVAASKDGSHFFVLNADIDRTYDSGSLLILDGDGAPVHAHPTPRLGRSLSRAGTDLLATFDRPEDGAAGQVALFDVSTPAAPIERIRWEIDCSPISSVLREGYKFFAVSCLGGALYLGVLGDDRKQSTLVRAREYGHSRRALFLSPDQGLLFAFPTAMDGIADGGPRRDEYTVAEDGTKTPGPNEIPDEDEETVVRRRLVRERRLFQVAVIDLAAEYDADREGGFEFHESMSPAAQAEMTWLYYPLANFDGSLDSDVGTVDLTHKHYRTNFWEAVPDPDRGDTFYVSERGKDPGRNTNNVVRVRIVGPRVVAGKLQPTPAWLDFERVYGFKGQTDEYHYPGDIDLATVGGRTMLLVNHFRDLRSWNRADVRFSVAAAALGDDLWFDELSSSDTMDSYFQFAVGREGRILVGSFYGNRLILLDLEPSVGISVRKTIE